MPASEIRRYWIADTERRNADLSWHVWYGKMSIGDILYLVRLKKDSVAMEGGWFSQILVESDSGLIGWASVIQATSATFDYPALERDDGGLTYEATTVVATTGVLFRNIISLQLLRYEEPTLIKCIEGLGGDYPIGPRDGLAAAQIEALSLATAKHGYTTPPMLHTSSTDARTGTRGRSSAAGSRRNTETRTEWDAFICHASEDKKDFAQPLAEALLAAGVQVWYDDLSLRVGDSLRRSIDRGLSRSRWGIVIISESFLEKEWPQKELDGLIARESDGRRVILPVWHGVTFNQVVKYSPSLADRVAAKSSSGLGRVVSELLTAMDFEGVLKAE